MGFSSAQAPVFYFKKFNIQCLFPNDKDCHQKLLLFSV